MSDETLDRAYHGQDLAAALDEFKREGMPPHAKVHQRNAMEYAFWSGAAAAHSIIVNILSNKALDQTQTEALMNKACSDIETEGERIAKAIEAANAAEAARPTAQLPAASDKGESRLVKIDPVTGEETFGSHEEQKQVLELFRRALSSVENGIQYSEQAREQLKERGMTEDQINAMLAEMCGIKQ